MYVINSSMWMWKFICNREFNNGGVDVNLRDDSFKNIINVSMWERVIKCF